MAGETLKEAPKNIAPQTIETGLVETKNVIGAGKTAVEGGVRAMESISTSPSTEELLDRLTNLTNTLPATLPEGFSEAKVYADLEEIGDKMSDPNIPMANKVALLDELSVKVQEINQKAVPRVFDADKIVGRSKENIEVNEISDARKAELSIQFLQDRGMLGATISSIIHPFDKIKTDSRQAGLFAARIKEFQKRVCNFTEHDGNDPNLSDGIFGQKTFDLYKQAVDNRKMNDGLGLFSKEVEKPAAVVEAPKAEDISVVPEFRAPEARRKAEKPINAVTDLGSLQEGDYVKLVNNISTLTAGDPVRVLEVKTASDKTEVKIGIPDGEDQWLKPSEFQAFNETEAADSRALIARGREAGKRADEIVRVVKNFENKDFANQQWYAPIKANATLQYSAGEGTGAKTINNGAVKSGDVVAVITKNPEQTLAFVQSSDGKVGWISINAIKTDTVVAKADADTIENVKTKIAAIETARNVSTTAAAEAAGGPTA